MKYIFAFLIITQIAIAQSVTIDPTNSVNKDMLKISKSGIGLNHEFGLSQVGTYATGTSGYIQTHSNHPLLFSTNNGGAHMVIGTNGNIGMGMGNNFNPSAKLEVVGSIKNSALAGIGTRPVMADANGILTAGSATVNAIAFSAYQGVAQSLIPSVHIKLLVDTEKYDFGNNFNPTTNAFTAPIDGIYHFDANCTISTGTATSGGILLVLSSIFQDMAQTNTEIHSASDYNTNVISKDVKLLAGEVVSISVYNASSQTLMIQNTAPSYYISFSGHLVFAL